MPFRHFALEELHNETRFPTAMSYGSDAQWSDSATVCSDESVGNDLEEEELQNANRETRSPVVFPNMDGNSSFPRPQQFHYLQHSPDADDDHRSTTTAPLPAQIDEMDSETSSITTKEQQQYDCNASLDVETHSVGGHSCTTILSLDDSTNTTVMAWGAAAAAAQHDHCAAATDLATVQSIRINSGRQSPGGTIYKGRGKRAYKGRYMHLPLKRFHSQVHDIGTMLAEPRAKRRMVERLP